MPSKFLMICIYISNYFWPEPQAVAVRSSQLVYALSANVGRTCVLSTGCQRLFGAVEVDGLNACLIDNRLPLGIRLVGELKLSLLFAMKLALLLFRYRQHSCVVVVSTPPLWIAMMCGAVAKVMGAPLAVDVRDRYPEVLFSTGVLRSESWIGLLLLKLEKQLYRSAFLVTTVTSTLARAIERDHGIKHVKVIRNGYDPQLFLPDLSLTAPTPQQYTIITFGLFGRFFDDHTYAQILARCRLRGIAARFIVVGYGSKFKRLEALAASEPALQVHSAVSQQELAARVATCQLMLSLHVESSSMLGAFPVKVFEAIGCGLPSLVIPRSEAGQELQSRKMGWTYAAAELDRIVDRIEMLLIRPELWHEARQQTLAYRGEYERATQARRFASELVLGLSQGASRPPAGSTPAC